MLHPTGPEGEDDYDEEEDDDDEATEEEVEKEDESLDMEEYKQAMLELEGLKVRDPHADVQEEDSESEIREEQKETQIASTARSDEETEKGLDEEFNEAEDECPDLADLSASNKEFKPFR